MLFTFQYHCELDICGSLRQLFYCIGVLLVTLHWNIRIFSKYIDLTKGNPEKLYGTKVHISTRIMILVTFLSVLS